MNEGWIKLFRKFMEWEWYRDQNTKAVFIHLLLLANTKDKRYKGKVIERGQTLTSVDKIADALGLDRKTIMRCLECLESTDDIAVESHRGRYGGSLITIRKYSEYQFNCGNNGQLDGQLNVQNEDICEGSVTDCDTTESKSNCGNNGPLTGHLPGLLPGHNIRIKEYKNNTTPSSSPACEKTAYETGKGMATPIHRTAFLLYTDTMYLENVAMATGCNDIEKIKGVISVWEAEVKAREGADTNKSLSDARSHFLNYFRIWLSEEKRRERKPSGSSMLHFEGEKKVTLNIS